MLRLNEYNNRELLRLYRIFCKRVELLLAGGLQYGWDLPTLRVLYPGLAEAIMQVLVEKRKRGL